MSMTAFSAFGYASVGVFYALLTVLLLTSWRGRRIGALLIVASIVSVAWGVILAIKASGAYSNIPLLFSVEVLRGGAWITFLTVLAGQVGISKLVRYASLGAWLAVLTAGFGLFLTKPWYAAIEQVTDVMIPGGLIIALTGLILIEQLYRNSPYDTRWGLKSLVLGLGGIFAYDLFLYSQAMLFGVLDSTTWYARGAVNLMFLPLIAFAARRNPKWDLDIFVSRQVVFYSTTLVAVGLYLVLMSLGGYALVLFGGSWGALAQVVFFTGAILILGFLLFSSTLRARAKVFLSKHFFRNKYDYRDEWLRLVSTLSGFRDSSTREVVIQALTQIVGSSSGTLWLLDEDEEQYRVAANYNSDVALPDIEESESVVDFMRRQAWLIDLDEYRSDPDRYDNLVLPDWLESSDDAWLVVPLLLQKVLVGLVLVNRAPVKFVLNYEDRDLLKTVGSHIAVHLIQERSDNMLTEARQFEAYNRLTAFLMHDLNNLIAQQSLIVENAKKHRRNPDFVDDAMRTIANSVDRMKKVMDQLRRRGDERIRRSVKLDEILTEAVERCGGNSPRPQLQLNGLRCRVNANSDQLTMVLVHLIKNAQEATSADGKVRVQMGRGDGRVNVSIEDTGSGMAPEFVRSRLFRPFDSTKGVKGMGIGAYQAREFVRNAGGEMAVHSQISVGTTVTLSLPADFGEEEHFGA
jgi:putative PEP-CTERM system histidine kinase